MEFALPAGLWLGLAAAGVLTAHLVRRRARVKTVPFLPLWISVLAQRRGGFGSAMVRYLDLFLVLIACCAVALAAGSPFIPGKPDRVRDVVLVVDGGVELRAGGRGGRLLKVVEAEVRRRAPGTRIAILFAADRGATVWSGTDKAAALHFVRGRRAGWLPTRTDGAVALAREAGRVLREPDLVFCTCRDERPDGFRVRVVGEAVRNAGVASLEVLADPEGRGRLVRVGLRGHGDVEIEGHWNGDVDGFRVIDVPLPIGGRFTLTVNAVGDGFAPDDHAYLLVPTRKVPRILVVSEQDPSPFLVAALQALEETGVIEGPLGRTTPQHSVEAARRNYDVLIFDRCAPPERISRARCLYLAPPPGALPFKVGEHTAAPALFDVQRDHPLLAGYDLQRIPPRRARAVLGGEALAHAAPGPVLAATSGWIALGFDPDRCVFAASPAYPLFLRNCIVYLADVLPQAAAEFYTVNEPAAEQGVAQVDGFGPVRVLERWIGPPGFWKLGDQTYAVNLLDPDLDLSPPSAPSDPLADVGDPGTPDQPLAAPFSAAAVVLLLLAWWLFWRK